MSQPIVFRHDPSAINQQVVRLLPVLGIAFLVAMAGMVSRTTFGYVVVFACLPVLCLTIFSLMNLQLCTRRQTIEVDGVHVRQVYVSNILIEGRICDIERLTIFRPKNLWVVRFYDGRTLLFDESLERAEQLADFLEQVTGLQFCGADPEHAPRRLAL